MNRSNANNQGCLEGNFILGERNGIYSWRIPLTITLIDHSIICPKKTFTLTIDTTYIYIYILYVVYIYIYTYLCVLDAGTIHFFFGGKAPHFLATADIKRDVAIHILYIYHTSVLCWLVVSTPLKNITQLG